MRVLTSETPVVNGNTPPVPQTAAAPEQAAPIKLSTVAGILWRRLWLIVLCMLLAPLVAILVVRNITPVYRGTSKIYVDKTGPVIISKQESELFRGTNFQRTQAEIIRSRPVLVKILNNPTVKKAVEGVTNPAAFLKENLEAKVGDDDLLYVSWDAKQPETASEVTNAIVESYVEFIAEQRRSTASEILRILQKEKEKQDGEFSERLKRLTDFRMSHGDIHIGAAQAVHPVLTQVAQYSDALSKASLELVEFRALYDAASALKEDTLSLQQFLQTRAGRDAGEMESAKVRRVRDQLDTFTIQLKDMQRQYKPEHGQVKWLQGRVDELQKELEKAEADYRAAVMSAFKQHVELCESRVNRLESLVTQQRTKAASINEGLAKLELLQAELNQSKQMVDLLNTRIRELNITDDAGAMNVIVLEPAVPMSRPYWPNMGKFVRFAFAFGLILGLVAALSLEVVDDRIRSAEAASDALRLPLLAVVPATYKTGNALARLVSTEPRSVFSEVFRTLRTAIFFGTLDHKRDTILLTSPMPGEGKSTTAANLAQSFAQVGRKTILVDCDFRRPRVHSEFELPDGKGISSVIAGEATLEEAIYTNVEQNLDLLPCGPIPPNPSELLNSSAFRDLLKQIHERYEHVIIDSPPLLAVADARILAAMVDVVLLVIRADKSRRRPARQAREQLDSVGANTLGLIINGAPRSTERYGYGYGYGAYNYYDTYGERTERASKEQVEAPVPAAK